MNKKEASKLFDEALPRIESESIRKWAQGQKDIWVHFIPQFTFRDENKARALATFITLEALG